MVVSLYDTETIDEINLPIDGPPWSPLVDNHRHKSQTKYFSKHILNSRMFSGGEMKVASAGNFGLARLYIVSGVSTSRALTL